MTGEPDPRLQTLLGGESLSGLRQRLRRHFERAAADAPQRPLALGALSGLEREALALLTGRAAREAKSIRLDLDALDAALRAAGIAASLRQALELLDGPIVHKASLRASAQAGWAAVVAGCQHPALAQWLAAPAALGLLKRLARQDATAAARLLEHASAVLRRLPAKGQARSELAAQTLGDAHALDSGRAIATLVLSVWRLPTPGDAAHPPMQAAPDESTRDTWARAGVLVNELARPALFLNLPVQAHQDPLSAAGEPGYLSLRRLLRAPPAWAVDGAPVFVCENPNLVAIASDALGARCAPLICTDGMPAAAQRSLLVQMAQAGARLHYHGDFDWPGLQIGNHVMQLCAAVPWRFGHADYKAAAASASHLPRDFVGAEVVAAWDIALAPAMRRLGLAISEEAVAAPLLLDLAQR